MESDIFKNAIKRSFIEDAKTDSSPIQIISPLNISQIITIENNLESNVTSSLKKLSDNAKKDRDEHNVSLYNYALYNWGILMAFTIFIAFLHLLVNYYYFRKGNYNNLEKVNSVSNLTIEMVDQNYSDEERILTNENDVIVRENKEDNEKKNFIDYNKLKKNLVKKSIYYIALSASLILFEYLFFNYIILKYHIISKEEMEYILYQILNPLIKSYVVVS